MLKNKTKILVVLEKQYNRKLHGGGKREKNEKDANNTNYFFPRVTLRKVINFIWRIH